MLRKGTWSAVPAVLLAASLLGPAAWAGEPGKACHCAHAKAKHAAQAVAGPSAEPSHDAAQAPAHEALVETGRQLLAAKCSCESKADCTCKKGECKCKKCGGRHEVLEALQGQRGTQPVKDARYDASACVML
jgi:hypothetical protein